MPTIACFDGVSCIGGNNIVVEDGGSWLFSDFGKKLASTVSNIPDSVILTDLSCIHFIP